jgi:glucose-6-phosphate 1-dehydrogenase
VRKDVIRGQFRGHRTEKGVAPDSKVETFAAPRLEINSWRWQGVPFYIRAGKCLPATCTEILVRLRRPPTVYPSAALKPSHMRLQVTRGDDLPRHDTPVYEYQPGTWGPGEVDRRVSPSDGWHNPTVTSQPGS